MADIRVVWSPEMMAGDWSLVAGLLDTDQELVTAAAVALFTWRTALADDVLMGDPTDRKGWWGDHEASDIHGGWPIGSRLWLLVREKQTEDTRNRAEAYIREAIDPLIGIGLADAYDLDVAWFQPGMLGAELTFVRGARGSIAVRFETLWDQIA